MRTVYGKSATAEFTTANKYFKPSVALWLQKKYFGKVEEGTVTF
jgi:hypothetical protein